MAVYPLGGVDCRFFWNAFTAADEDLHKAGEDRGECGECREPYAEGTAYRPGWRESGSTEKEGQEVPGGDVDIVPWVLAHGGCV
ncbi:MAG: hypothetical protein JOZ83_15385, partial [Silvibacterium sp.]|nr:hypothetical protein [Silvibacterium sp.]